MPSSEDFERVRPLLREAAHLWSNYRDFYRHLTVEERVYCLPPSLVEDFERLGKVIGDVDLTMADI
jgi:hypothetical protein